MTTLQPWAFLLATIAAYRVSRMIISDDGPFDIFSRIRGALDPAQKTWIGRGINCIVCVSFWVTLLTALLLQASALEWLAMAGLIVMWREVMAK